MKNIILLIAFTSLLFSCSSDNNNSSNNNGNSFTNSMDYEFTITINGEVHKVKGNTTNGIPFGNVNSATHTINNQCTIQDNSGIKFLYLQINDVTAPNYISGQNIICLLNTNNLLLGNTVFSVALNGSYFTNLFTNLGSINGDWQTVNGPQDYNISRKLPITITDLGTGTLSPQTYPLPLYNFGQTLKGNYNGTIYLSRYYTQNGVLIYDIPVQISIDFKALRMY
jgi:hypothetical protein